MIVGIGVDLVDIARIRAALDNPRTGTRFRDRVFTAAEIAYCERRAGRVESFAARFAAKEATIKALGGPCGWHDVEVERSDGVPSLRLAGRAAARAAALGVVRLHLSLSHADTQAAAFVVAEARP